MIDAINGEIDKRKIAKLVDDNVISQEELAHPIIVLECPKCKHHQNPDNNACEKCGKDIS